MEIYKGGRMIQSFINFITFYKKPKKINWVKFHMQFTDEPNCKYIDDKFYNKRNSEKAREKINNLMKT